MTAKIQEINEGIAVAFQTQFPKSTLQENLGATSHEQARRSCSGGFSPFGLELPQAASRMSNHVAPQSPRNLRHNSDLQHISATEKRGIRYALQPGRVVMQVGTPLLQLSLIRRKVPHIADSTSHAFQSEWCLGWGKSSGIHDLLAETLNSGASHLPNA